jgi:hypothetical protein
MVRDLARRLTIAGLALFASLLCAEGALAQNIPPPYSSVDANGADLSTGALILSETPISVGGDGGGLGREFFQAGAGRDQVSATLNMSAPDLDHANYTYVVSFGSTSAVFTRANLLASTPFVAADNSGSSTLQIDGNGKYVFYGADGAYALFSPSLASSTPVYANTAQAEQVVKPNGEIITYTYTAITCGSQTCYRLQAATSNLGYMIKYQYVADGANSGNSTLYSVKAINLAYDYCDPAASSCATANTWMSTTLAGTTSGTGTYTATDALQHSTQYTLNQGFLTKIVRPGGLTYTYDYDTQSRIHWISAPGVTAGTLRVWTYDYDDTGPTAKIVVTDPDSRHSTATFNKFGGFLISISDSEGQGVQYDRDPITGRVNKVTNSPLGDSIEYHYDARGNIDTITHKARPGSGLADAVTHLYYPASCTSSNLRICNKPSYVVDPRGKRTDYVYSPDHGGVIRVTGPADNTSTPARPQTRYTYSPLYAWYKNSAGTLAQAASIVWRLTSTSVCVTGNGVDPVDPTPLSTNCGGAANEIKTTYAYGTPGAPNNLQVTAVTVGDGAGGSATTTAYAYDPYGNVASVDGPNPGSQDTAYFRYNAGRQLTDAIGVDPDGQNTGRPASAIHYTYLDDGRPNTIESGTAASATAAVVVAQVRKADYDLGGRLAKER